MTNAFFNRLGETIVGIFKEPVDAIFNSQPVEVVFDESHQDIDIAGKPYGAPRPVAWVVTGSINPVYGDPIHIDGKDYTVIEVKIDGMKEVTQLNLQEA
jgi:hypothetical protein